MDVSHYMTKDERRAHRLAWRAFSRALGVKWADDPGQRSHRRAWRQFCRALVIRKLGAACVCCGETLTLALTFDHVDGRGNVDRARMSEEGRAGGDLAVELFGEKHPECIQVMCLSCNQMKGQGRECPHQTIERIQREIESLERAA
jgi:hypothetical protein